MYIPAGTVRKLNELQLIERSLGQAVHGLSFSLLCRYIGVLGVCRGLALSPFIMIQSKPHQRRDRPRDTQRFLPLPTDVRTPPKQ